MRLAVVFLLSVLLFARAPLAATGSPSATGPDCLAATVQTPSTITGARVEGSIRYLTGRSFEIVAGADIQGDIFLPGSPRVHANSGAQFEGVVDGDGAPVPDNYDLHLRSHSRVGRVVGRTDPVALPQPPAPEPAGGTRWVRLKRPGDDAGDFGTVGNLTVQGRGLEVALPPGAYDTVRVHPDNTIVLGIAGATAPGVYSFENLVLSPRTELAVVGPVEVRVRRTVTIQGSAGHPAHPQWLSLSSPHGGLALSGGGALHGAAIFPRGTVTLHPRSTLHGHIFASDLRLLPGSRLICSADPEDRNDPPAAHDLALETLQDEELEITLAGSDPEGAELTFAIDTPPAHGFLAGAPPALTYVPDLGFFGSDSFTYRVNDGTHDSALATVTIEVIEVNVAPIAQDLAVELHEGEQNVAILLQAVDPEGGTLEYEILAPPALGTLSGTPPELLFSHDGREIGPEPVTDFFTFHVRDDHGQHSDVAVVTLTILPVNHPPLGGTLDLRTDEDHPVTVTLAAVDPENDPLTYELVTGPGEGPHHGLATLDFGGLLTYTPQPDFHGADAFAVQVTDPSGAAAVLSVAVTVDPVNDPPAAFALVLVTEEDTPLAVTLAGTDLDGDPLTFSVDSPPGHGALAGSPPDLLYTPAPDFHGQDRFTYRANDGELDSAPATVTIDVTPVNDPPVAGPVAGLVTESPVSIALRGSDPDGDPLTYRLLSPPATGELAIDGDTATFTTDDLFFGVLEVQYTASDGEFTSAPALLRLVSELPPTVRLLTPGDGARFEAGASIPLRAEATDPDGTIASTELFINGQPAFRSATGSLEATWTPAQPGAHTITAAALDNDGHEALTAPVTVTVAAPNAAPLVFAGSDREATALTLGPNLILNPGNELPGDPGEIAHWTRLDGANWVQGNEDTRSRPIFGGRAPVYPAAFEGAFFFAVADQFGVSPRLDGRLAQTIDLSPFAAAIDAGAQSLLFRSRVRIPLLGETRDRGAIGFLFLDDHAQPLGESILAAEPSDLSWLPLAQVLVPPPGARAVQLALLAGNRDPDDATDVLFDALELRALGPSSVTLDGHLGDDGLPLGNILSHAWTQLAGPPVALSDPGALRPAVAFLEAGRYRFQLAATDGELAAAHTVTITVTAGANHNAPPVVDAGPDLDVHIGLDTHPLAPAVGDDGLPAAALSFLWQKVSGPGPLAFTTPEELNTGVIVAVPGEYVIRLTADDGELFASDELTLAASCPDGRPPLDLYLVTDHSGSMFGPAEGILDELNPDTGIFQARLLALALIDQLDPAADRVAVAKNSGIRTDGSLEINNYGIDLTADLDAARDAVFMVQGEPAYTGSFGSFVSRGLGKIVPIVRDSRRPEARQVVIHLNDGFGSFEFEHLAAVNELKAEGTTIVIVSLANLAGDHIAEEEIRPYASTPAHYLVSEDPLAAAVNRLMRLAASATCLGYNLAPEVFAGTPAYLPDLAQPFVPGASFTDDHAPAGAAYSFFWTQLAGPAPAAFSDPAALNPAIAFPSPGAYELELRVSDGDLAGADRLVVLAQADCEPPTPPGLVAYWPFDTHLRDLAGNRLLASPFVEQPPAFLPGAGNEALHTSARTRTIVQSRGDSLGLLDSSPAGFTISFWLRPHSLTEQSVLFGFQSMAHQRGADAEWRTTGGTKGKVAYNLRLASGGTLSFDSNDFEDPAIAADAWNHLALSYHRGTGELVSFVNGVETNRTTRSGVLLDSGQLLRVLLPRRTVDAELASPLDRASYTAFDGALDELAFFDRPLALAEVALLRASRSGLCLPSQNRPPFVDAGDPIHLDPGILAATLAGFVTDDNPDLDIAWSTLAGPGTVTFDDPSDPATTATFPAPGHYTLELSAFDGFQTVRDILPVRAGLPCTPAPAGLLSWLPGNAHLHDLAHPRQGSVGSGTAAFAPAVAGDGFLFTADGSYLRFDAPAAADPPGTSFTWEAWVRVDQFTPNATIVSFREPGSLTEHGALRITSGDRLQFAIRQPGGGTNSFTIPDTLVAGQFYHLAFAVDPAVGRRLYLDGALVQSGSFHGGWLNPWTLETYLGGFPGGSNNFAGVLDEFAVYNRALDPAEIQSLVALGADGKCHHPAISALVEAGPDVSLPLGTPHQFSATVDPSGFAAPPAVAWRQLSGPAEAALDDPNSLTATATLPAPGRYLFQLAATDGAVTASDTATVDVLAPANQPPAVELSAPATLQLPDATADLLATVTDDGLPAGTLHGAWTQLSGPATVLLESAGGFDARAAFTAAGSYTLQFTATDSLLTAGDTVSIEVLPAPVPNGAPAVDLGPDLTLPSNSFSPAPTVSDDGKPAPAALGYRWISLSGPAAPAISDPSLPSPLLTFPLAGTYRLQLTVSDGELSASDTLLVTVSSGADGLANEPPRLDPIANQTLVLPDRTATLHASFTDDGRSGHAPATAWRQLAGPAATFSSATGPSTTVTLTDPGDYLLEFEVSDGEFIARARTTVRLLAAPNAAPVVEAGPDRSSVPGGTITLNGTASDDGLPAGTLTTTWSWRSAPVPPVIATPHALATEVTFPVGGTYVLELAATDGQLTSRATVTCTVVADPSIEFLSPADGAQFTDRNAPRLHARAVQEGGHIARVRFLAGGAELGLAANQPGTVDYFLDLPPLSYGLHSITAEATTADGRAATAETTFEHVDFDESRLVLDIASPGDDERVTAPAVVTGTVDSSRLAGYSLELEALPVGSAPRTLLATGSAPVIDDELGRLDPTLLRNGAYNLVLRAETTTGLLSELVQPVVIDGAMKIGHYALAFDDLAVPLSGIPLTVTRTYDSRDTSAGDFGPGWSVGLRSVAVRKTRPLGEDWEQSLAILPFRNVYTLSPTTRKRVMVRFPDGRTELFEAAVRARTPVSEDQPNSQIWAEISEADLVFRPLNGAQGTLEVAGDPGVVWLPDASFLGAGTLLDSSLSTLDPAVFRFTENDGTAYLIHEDEGLHALTDINGNSLTITENGMFHSSGEEVLFTRDPEGRITELTDPAGNQLHYSYDLEGRLAAFENRVGDLTRFHYENPSFPVYLTRIEDPRGVGAIRTEFDDDGRLIRQLDADGNAVEFVHDLSNRTETVIDPLGHPTVHEYDERGNVLRSVDPLGGVTLRTYDENDNELTTTTPEGLTTVHTFDNQNNILAQTDAAGHTTSFTYDAQGRPLAIADPLGHASVMAYGPAGNLLALADPLGNPSTFTYEPDGDLSTITDAAGNLTSFLHDSLGRQSAMTLVDASGIILRAETYSYDANGNQVGLATTRTLPDGSLETLLTLSEYDSENRLVRTVYPDGSETRVEHNEIGKQARTVDQLGRVTSYDYDLRGNLVRTTFPDLTTEEMAHDLAGRQVASTDRLGRTTYTVYDPLGRATHTIFPDATMPATVLADSAAILADPDLADNPRTVTVYDRDGRVTARLDENGNATSFEYDLASRRVRIVDALGHEMRHTHDAAGNQLTATDARGHVTSFDYDAANRRTRTIFPDRSSMSVEYDSLGRQIRAVDQEGNPTAFEHDGLGQLTAVVDALGHRTEYEHDERGSRTVQRDALGRETRYEYDALGRRTARILPEGQRESMAHNALGLLTARTDFNGHTTIFHYDSMNRLTSMVADPGHPSLALPHAPARFDYTHDHEGRRLTAVARNASGSVLSEEAWTYDHRDRLTTHTTPHGTLTYTYDPAGNLLTHRSDLPAGFQQSYTYDALNRLENLHEGDIHADPGGAIHLAAYAYDQVGNLSSTAYNNQVLHAYTYNSLNRLTNLTVGLHGASAPQQSYTYTLNLAGHRTAIAEHSGRAVTHTFDALHRLTSETIASDPAGHNGSIAYTHDPVGNRLGRSATGAAELTAKLPDQSPAYSPNDWLAHHSHDHNGNTIQSPESETGALAADTYDFRNKLVRRLRPDGATVDLFHTPDGDRIRKIVTPAAAPPRHHLYLVDRNNHTGYAQVVEELDQHGNLARRYHLGHDLLAADFFPDPAAPGYRRFFHYDGLGSTRALSDHAGAPTDSYSYDAFGSSLAATGTTPNTFLFAGEQFDPDLGMYFLRARYMNTHTGRFHSMDSYEGRPQEPMTLHKYAYAHVNPATNVDPTGHFSVAEVVKATFAWLGLTTKVYGFQIAYNRAAALGLINAAIQIRLVMMLRPVVFELQKLRTSIAVLNPAGAIKLQEYINEIRHLISVVPVFVNVALPMAFGAIPGLRGLLLSGGLTLYRFYEINKVAKQIIETAVKGAQHTNMITHYSFSGDVPARTVMIKSFIGVLDPAEDLGYLNAGIDSLGRRDFLSAYFYLRLFGEHKLKRYGIVGSGSFGSYPMGLHVDYEIEEGRISYRVRREAPRLDAP